jgi:hypothetical protein
LASDDDDYFELDVECEVAGGPHRHLVRIRSSPLIGLGLSTSRGDAPGLRRVHYTCPVTGEVRPAEFEPPPGFRWPFIVDGVE